MNANTEVTLAGYRLDWAIAVLMHMNPVIRRNGEQAVTHVEMGGPDQTVLFNPSSSQSVGGPIIEQYRPQMLPIELNGQKLWAATVIPGMRHQHGATYLEAAMRAIYAQCRDVSVFYGHDTVGA